MIRSPTSILASSPSANGSTAVTTTPLSLLRELIGYRVSNNSVYIIAEVYQRGFAGLRERTDDGTNHSRSRRERSSSLAPRRKIKLLLGRSALSFGLRASLAPVDNQVTSGRHGFVYINTRPGLVAGNKCLWKKLIDSIDKHNLE